MPVLLQKYNIEIQNLRQYIFTCQCRDCLFYLFYSYIFIQFYSQSAFSYREISAAVKNIKERAVFFLFFFILFSIIEISDFCIKSVVSQLQSEI